MLDDPRSPVTAETGAVLSDAVDALARAGVTVMEGWPEGIDPGQIAESFGFQVGLLFAFEEPGDQEFARLSVVIEQERRRMVARAAWSAYCSDVDVFWCPVNCTAAFPHDARPFDQRTIATADGERPYTDQPFGSSSPRCRACRSSRHPPAVPQMAFQSACRSSTRCMGTTLLSPSPRSSPR